MVDVQEIFDVEKTFAPEDWKAFAREVRFSRPGEFFFYEEQGESGIADCSKKSPEYARSLEHRTKSRNVTLGYKFSRWIHDRVFSPDTALFRLGKRMYERSKQPSQGPLPLRVLEHASKAVFFGCRDCGDCSLPDIAYLCPESQCAKNQRNGPCGGTRDGKCEVAEFECIWAKAYDRLKTEGREQHLLDHAPVVQDQSLRHTSAWGNTFRGIDHHRLTSSNTDGRATSAINTKPERA